MQIIPAINTSDPDEALKFIEALNDIILPHGYSLERVQIDVNDGTFENIKTITPEVLNDIDIKFKLDYHLMVTNPSSWVERAVRGQADRVIGQIEYMEDQLLFVEKATSLGVDVGFALDIGTPIEKIDETIITSLDAVLLMTYPAGKGGKTLEERVYGKIERLVDIKKKDTTPFKICLDGGITEDNIKKVKLSGVDEVAMTKRILEGNIEANLEEFYKKMY